MENPQVVVYTAWHYVGSIAPFLVVLALWIGRKWGEKRGAEEEKRNMWQIINRRLSLGKIFLKDPRNTKERTIQGVLKLRVPGNAEDREDGMEIGFNFIPESTQWKPGHCCSLQKKPELPA